MCWLRLRRRSTVASWLFIPGRYRTGEAISEPPLKHSSHEGCTDAAAGSVIVVVAMFKVLGSSMVLGEVGVIEIAVSVLDICIFVLGMVEGPVGDNDGYVFQLELRVSCCEVWVCGRRSCDLR